VAEDVEEALRELKHLLASTYKDSGSDAKKRLLELWMVLERALLQTEVNELRSAVLERLFGNETIVSPNRDSQRQLGGLRCQ
jgi:hypothetical protein